MSVHEMIVYRIGLLDFLFCPEGKDLSPEKRMMIWGEVDRVNKWISDTTEKAYTP